MVRVRVTVDPHPHPYPNPDRNQLDLEWCTGLCIALSGGACVGRVLARGSMEVDMKEFTEIRRSVREVKLMRSNNVTQYSNDKEK